MTSSLPSGDGTSTGTGPSSALDEDALPSTGNEPDTARTAAGEDQPSASPDTSVASDTAPSPDADVVPDGAGRPDADGASTAAAGPTTGGSTAGDSDHTDHSGGDRADASPSSGSGASSSAGSSTRPAPADDDAPGDSGAPDASAAAAPAAPDAEGPHAGDTSTAEGAVEGLNPAEAQDDLNPDSHRRPSDKVELDGPALENDEMRRATKDLQASQDATAEAKEYAADVRKQTLPGTSPTGM